MGKKYQTTQKSLFSQYLLNGKKKKKLPKKGMCWLATEFKIVLIENKVSSGKYKKIYFSVKHT